MNDVAKQLALIGQGTVQVTPEHELVKKLQQGKKLKVKLGMDPTAPDLHLGHAVVLSKMKQFQDLGHDVIFVIGDFTARIGDPTGKSKTRVQLSEEAILHNTQTYFEQVSKILDPARVTVRYNSEWLDALTMKDMVKLCAKVTLARLTEREDFAKRIAHHEPIGFHELLYPIFQGYDSVALHADVELGGTDQTFNLLFGRFLQEQLGQEAQVVITVPLLEGLDGHAKMSKSLGNAIGIAEQPEQAFGKLMSLSDEMMWRYMALLLNVTDEHITTLQEQVRASQLHPMDAKKKIAHDIIAKFWSEGEADSAQSNFEALFQKKDYSKAQEVSLGDFANPVWIVDLLKKLGAITTSTEAKRLIDEGAVSIDGQKMQDFKAHITWQSGMIAKVGKHRIYKIV